MKKRRGWSLKRELPILWSLCAREEPPHAGAVLVGLGQQFDALALEHGDDLRPYLAADIPVAALIGKCAARTDLEAVHGSRRDAGGLGESRRGQVAHIAVS
jgi:hypothetical protein